jgi:hypothetical protein
MDLKKNQPDFSSVNTFPPNLTILLLDLSVLEGVHRLVFWKHKNIKTYVSRQQIPGKYSTPFTGTKCKNIPSFTHTFRTKIKQGQLQKGGASTANPKKEHHHGGADRLV